ncbi:MAG TPA: DUF503 domain-containing protein [Candidatus Acidoferrum sp.]|nr:DUF503 domain-containing protein [Candidatus Acidoferrum sp.]
MALARLSLYIPHSHSLKEKRAVVRKIVDRIQARFKMHVAEVGGQDTWQRAVLGFAVVGSDARKAGQLADELVRAIQSLAEGEVIAIDRDTLRFGDDEAQVGAPLAADPRPGWGSAGSDGEGGGGDL